MYHSNIITAYKSQGVIGQEKVGVNIISNPMACLSETKLKITNIITARDLQISSAKENSPAPKLPKKETARVNISDTVVKVEPKTDRLPFVVPNVERSKVNLPVVDFRYYNNKPVYKGTTLPLSVNIRKPTPLTVCHGLLFSFIIIVGIFLGAFAGFGIYKAFQ